MFSFVNSSQSDERTHQSILGPHHMARIFYKLRRAPLRAILPNCRMQIKAIIRLLGWRDDSWVWQLRRPHPPCCHSNGEAEDKISVQCHGNPSYLFWFKNFKIKETSAEMCVSVLGSERRCGKYYLAETLISQPLGEWSLPWNYHWSASLCGVSCHLESSVRVVTRRAIMTRSGIGTTVGHTGRGGDFGERKRANSQSRRWCRGHRVQYIHAFFSLSLFFL